MPGVNKFIPRICSCSFMQPMSGRHLICKVFVFANVAAMNNLYIAVNRHGMNTDAFLRNTIEHQ
jgi:hypothetical protein